MTSAEHGSEPRSVPGSEPGDGTSPEAVAAGAVVSRKVKGGLEVVLVHRPRYDDWSWPKGKLDPDEPAPVAAVREVAEETGLDIRLGPPLPDQRYPLSDGGSKLVHYWVGRPVAGDDVEARTPTAEIDQVRWVAASDAGALLTHERDRMLLDDLDRLRRKTRTLVLLRHTKSRGRKSWRDDDRKRPLDPLGEIQAEGLVASLGAYGVGRVVSSSSTRCWATVAPYADVAGLELEVTDALSEEDAKPRLVSAEVRRLLGEPVPVVVCTHRPVFPMVFDVLGLDGEQRPALEPGAFLVVHHRHRRPVAVEYQGAPSSR
jgi:8-oxo-dGTP diphosphatase